ncbi:Imm10 family immunity protein [Pseudoxanthomonas sp. LjRoot143]|uniref:Imm10 family immunity protein n=1 Tax=Pseudoxanthomonas sp. LjRoot143 TaxID=3342266 RepID=UPI003ECE73F4
MSSFAFEAKCMVTEQPDGEFHLVGFADQKFDTRFYLMLQRALDHDEQDRALGMDTYHVEWCDQGMSGYGGISRFLLSPTGVEVSFEPQAAVDLDGMEHLSISFQLSHSEFLVLREALGNIFVGSGCLIVAGA